MVLRTQWLKWRILSKRHRGEIPRCFLSRNDDLLDATYVWKQSLTHSARVSAAWLTVLVDCRRPDLSNRPILECDIFIFKRYLKGPYMHNPIRTCMILWWGDGVIGLRTYCRRDLLYTCKRSSLMRAGWRIFAAATPSSALGFRQNHVLGQPSSYRASHFLPIGR